VVDSLQYGAEAEHYAMHSWVIMPNHVHLLLTPLISASKLLGSLKLATAKRARALLNRTGQPFWQDESYDHLFRGDQEFRRIQAYIANNPVTARLAVTPKDFLWSSVGRPGRPPQAMGLPRTVQ
jgi:putative DNA methylase